MDSGSIGCGAAPLGDDEATSAARPADAATSDRGDGAARRASMIA